MPTEVKQYEHRMHELATSAMDDPELAHHWRKIDRYDARVEYIDSMPPVTGWLLAPVKWFFAYRIRAHERSYANIADEY